MVQPHQDSNNPYASPEGDFSQDDHKEDGLQTVVYGSFWKRFFALVIDVIILRIISIPLSILVLTIFLPSFNKNNLNEDSQDLLDLAFLGFSFLLFWLYFAIQESSETQATFGKKLMGLRVTDEQGRRISLGRATGRFFGRFFSGIPLGLGYLIMPLTLDKQALHDLIAGTLVIKG